VLSYNPHSESCKAKQAITAIKAALAQPAPVQEPVGYVAENGVVDWNVCVPPILTDLYTRPPQRTEQEPVAWREVIKDLSDKYARAVVEFAKNIEKGANSMSPIAREAGDLLLALHTAIDAAPPERTKIEFYRLPQRTWVGLTDEDCRGMSAGDRLVAMWADRTLKEKNT
jgi:hypothetical protein